LGGGVGSQGTIAQPIYTIPGNYYSLSYMVTANYDNGINNKQYIIGWEGVNGPQSISKPTGWRMPDNLLYERRSHIFRATLPASDLFFRAGDSSGFGA
jgi:hypothetical protein